MKSKFIILAFILSLGSPVSLWAAGHGCAINLPDRDGDKVPDKDDLFPDDPTQSGRENDQMVDLHKNAGCPEGVPQLIVYMSPFAAPGAMNNVTIERDSAMGLAVCNAPSFADQMRNALGLPASGTAFAAAPLVLPGTSGLTPGVTAVPDEEGQVSDAAPCAEAPAGSPEMDPNAIRMKVEIPETKTVLFADQFGRGVMESPQGKQAFSLSCAQRAQIERMTQDALSQMAPPALPAA